MTDMTVLWITVGILIGMFAALGLLVALVFVRLHELDVKRAGHAVDIADIRLALDTERDRRLEHAQRIHRCESRLDNLGLQVEREAEVRAAAVIDIEGQIAEQVTQPPDAG